MSAIRPEHYYRPVTLPDSAYDSFGNIRVVTPTTLFDSQQQYGQSPLLWETVETGNGTATHLPNESAVRLRTTGASGDKVVRQTREYFRYQPGKSLKIGITGQAPASTTNRRFRAGYFDDKNGVFVEFVDGEVYLVLRSYVSGSVVDDRVPQSEWSEDRMDGSLGENNRSCWKLDPTKSFIFIPDLEWLGVGTVRAGFQINGKGYYAHEWHHANVGSSTYMTTANLPVRYEIENTDTTGGVDDARAICATIVSEGGFENGRGFPFGADRSALKAVTTEVPIFAIRPTLLLNGIENRAQIEVESLDFYAETTAAVFRMYYGAAVTGGTWTAFNATHSGVEYNEGLTSITGGIRVGPALSTPASSQGQRTSPSAVRTNILSKLPMTLNIAGAHPTTPFADTYVITAQSVGGVATSNVWCSVAWREIY